MKNYLFVVEGIHDVALVSKILMILGFSEIKTIKKVKNPMDKLISKSFPFQGTSLNVFNKIPFFYERDNEYVCIVNANGEKNLLSSVDSSLIKLELQEMERLNKIVVICDGDLDNKEEKIEKVTDGTLKENKKIKRFDIMQIKNQIIKVTDVEDFAIPFEIFVLPNNKDSGRLEDILLESINIVDKELGIEVDNFLTKVPNRYKLDWSDENSKYEKTKIACVGSILNPGVANGVHIKDSEWISENTINESKHLNSIFNYIKNILKD
ncbi:MAG: DUF3226 domain-containing protein [Peptostreptococcaceae bacterium]